MSLSRDLNGYLVELQELDSGSKEDASQPHRFFARDVAQLFFSCWGSRRVFYPGCTSAPPSSVRTILGDSHRELSPCLGFRVTFKGNVDHASFDHIVTLWLSRHGIANRLTLCELDLDFGVRLLAFLVLVLAAGAVLEVLRQNPLVPRFRDLEHPELDCLIDHVLADTSPSGK